MSKSRAEQEIELVRGAAQLRVAWSREDSKMFAFLSIFHPEMPLEERLSLAREVRTGIDEVHRKNVHA